MNFSDITVTGITGSAAYTQGTLYALMRSCAELPESRGLLISPDRPHNLPDHIRHLPCQPFGYLEYNIFVLYQLAACIDTDYCLIVQNDGWVLNGANWNSAYRSYDYIGAPLPILGESRPEGGVLLHPSSEYVQRQHLIGIEDGLFEPQNGGFSLRSRKLLEAPRRLGIPLTIQPPAEPDHSRPLGLHWDWKLHHEDLFLCAVARDRLEASGIRFAPPAIATQFAVETPGINQMRGIPLENVFGCHWMGAFTLTGYSTVRMAPSSADDTGRNALYLDLFQKYGYEIEYGSPSR